MRPYHDLTEIGRARRLRPLVWAALDHYDLDVVRLRLMTNETNGVFRIDTARRERFVARVGLGGAIGHPPEQVEVETAWLAELAAGGSVAVPEVIGTSDGRRFVTVEADEVPDPRNVVVFSWLPGRVVDDEPSPRVLGALGRVAADLHRAGASFVPPHPDVLPRYDRPFPFHEPVVLFDDALVEPSWRTAFRAALDAVADAIGRYRDPLRVVHGDLNPWNVMVTQQGLAVFDFEDVMWAHPIQDIATSLYYFDGRPEWQEARSAFRSGYEAVDAWPEARAGDLEVFMAGRALVLANDVLITPEWRDEAGHWLPRMAARIERLLGR